MKSTEHLTHSHHGTIQSANLHVQGRPTQEGVAIRKDLRNIQLQTIDDFQGSEAAVVLLDLVVTDCAGFVRELLIMENSFTYILEQDVVEMEPSFFLDYHSGNRCLSRSESLRRYDRFIIHQLFSKVTSTCRPLSQSAPLRGQLKIATYGRQHLLETFEPGKCLSLSFLCFIDGFDLY